MNHLIYVLWLTAKFFQQMSDPHVIFINKSTWKFPISSMPFEFITAALQQSLIFSLMISATESPAYIIDYNLKFILPACQDDYYHHHDENEDVANCFCPMSFWELHFPFCPTFSTPIRFDG